MKEDIEGAQENQFVEGLNAPTDLQCVVVVLPSFVFWCAEADRIVLHRASEVRPIPVSSAGGAPTWPKSHKIIVGEGDEELAIILGTLTPS